ncbi:hypothetical protein CPB84DRAFT_1827987 [Gymnopilus junonius]|uniref:Uncharacterized protein n=1 Tax=Gymnopilus junonius TaxID=109634 RepID=A0A9P5NEF9_GYMJU|nr:hypothetical protein CPB84DRAFT_1827987 [Gymnopilus junonius]
MIPKTSAEILAAVKPPLAKKSRKKHAPLFSTQTSTFSMTELTSTATEQSTLAASLLQLPILAGSSQTSRGVAIQASGNLRVFCHIQTRIVEQERVQLVSELVFL